MKRIVASLYKIQVDHLSNGVLIHGRVFGWYSVLTTIFLTSTTTCLTLYFHSALFVILCIPLLLIQPFLNHFSINISSDLLEIKMTYLGISVMHVKSIMNNVIVVNARCHNISVTHQEMTDSYLVLDFFGDWDSSEPYINVTFQQRGYIFSADMPAFENELWNLVVEWYCKIRLNKHF